MTTRSARVRPCGPITQWSEYSHDLRGSWVRVPFGSCVFFLPCEIMNDSSECLTMLSQYVRNQSANDPVNAYLISGPSISTQHTKMFKNG